MSVRKQAISLNAPLSVKRQCELLRVPRSSYYAGPPAPESDEDLALKEWMDASHLLHPYWGSRNFVMHLDAIDITVNRKKVQRLMREMGLKSSAPKPDLSRPNKAHVIFPYLLRNVAVTKPNQVWAADITYIPLEKGWAYLVAVIDWHSRKVLAHRLSNTMEVRFCVDALEEALAKFGKPDIFNTDQGAQFTAEAFVSVLKANDIRISMDGKGRCLDNVFVERLWRSLKYEDVYPKKYFTQAEAAEGIADYMRYFNEGRLHQGLNGRTPDEVYFASNEQYVANAKAAGENEGRIWPTNDERTLSQATTRLKTRLLSVASAVAAKSETPSECHKARRDSLFSRSSLDRRVIDRQKLDTKRRRGSPAAQSAGPGLSLQM